MTRAAATSHADLLYEAHAAVCKVLANASRLRIVEALGEGELSVGAIAQKTGASMSGVSQHLALMRSTGVVEARRSAGFVYYRLTSPKTFQAWNLMREVLLERLAAAGELSATGGAGKSRNSRRTGGRGAAR